MVDSVKSFSAETQQKNKMESTQQTRYNLLWDSQGTLNYVVWLDKLKMALLSIVNIPFNCALELCLTVGGVMLCWLVPHPFKQDLAF